MTSARPAVTGLRTVAAFEAAKGLLVLVAGLGALSLLHHDLQHAAESVVRHLHLNPARHYPRIFIEAAAHTTDKRLWLLAGGAFAYTSVRAVEAYGLWRARPWAEWFAILSGALYLPVEIEALAHHPSLLKALLLLGNLVIVLYVGYVRLAGVRERRRKEGLAARPRPQIQQPQAQQPPIPQPARPQPGARQPEAAQPGARQPESRPPESPGSESG